MKKEKIVVAILLSVAVLMTVFVLYIIRQPSGLIQTGAQYEFRPKTIVKKINSYQSDFPKELILEFARFSDAKTTRYPDGLVETNISYLSPNSMKKVIDLYKSSVLNNGWTTNETNDAKKYLLDANREKENIKLNLVPSTAKETIVDLIYTKNSK